MVGAIGEVPPDYVPPKLFRSNDQGEISVDWNKYSTPEQTQSRTDHPENYGVMQLIAGDVRAIPLEVNWTPEPDNKAHSDIRGIPVEDGPEKVFIRGKLSNFASIVLPVPEL